MLTSLGPSVQEISLYSKYVKESLVIYKFQKCQCLKCKFRLFLVFSFFHRENHVIEFEVDRLRSRHEY